MPKKMSMKKAKASARKGEPPGNASDYDALPKGRRKRIDRIYDIRMQRGGNPPR